MILIPAKIWDPLAHQDWTRLTYTYNGTLRRWNTSPAFGFLIDEKWNNNKAIRALVTPEESQQQHIVWIEQNNVWKAPSASFLTLWLHSTCQFLFLPPLSPKSPRLQVSNAFHSRDMAVIWTKGDCALNHGLFKKEGTPVTGRLDWEIRGRRYWHFPAQHCWKNLWPYWVLLVQVSA